MKRFWLAMLSLGLVLAFSASAMAVDVKFSGSFYAAGMYLDKTTFRSTYDTGAYTNTAGGRFGYGSQGPSTAFYYQRLRLQTDFIVSPGLKLVTRFDALERIWGGARGSATTPGFVTALYSTTIYNNSQSAGKMEESQNIAFDWAYASYVSPIGLIEVGYMADNGWGTVFGNNVINGSPIGKINYLIPIGPVYLTATAGKKIDNSASSLVSTNATDRDYDTYSLGAIFVANKDIQIGLLGGFQRVATGRQNPMFYSTQDSIILPNGTAGYNAVGYSINPYAKAKFGPVSVEAEVNYAMGTVKWEDLSLGPYSQGEIDISNLTAYVSAVADFGMVYGGATFAYVSGDEDETKTKLEGGFIDGGVDFTPTLLMFNNDLTYWAGKIPGYGYANSGAYLGSLGPEPMGGALKNAWLGQGKIGVRPIPALDIMASLTYAKADKLPTAEVLKKDYGWEVDVTGTYKITNNLSYMLGAAYLFTGDYYKGTNTNDVENNFLIINKLTLTF